MSRAVLYPNTVEGLQQQIRDILNAAKARDEQHLKQLIRGLILPGASAWFEQVFSAQDAARLAAAYEKDLSGLPGRVRSSLLGAARQEDAQVYVRRLTGASDPDASDLEKAVLEAEVETAHLYLVRVAKPGGSSAAALSYFVYQGDRFRLIRAEVFGALGGPPAASQTTQAAAGRVRVGGDLQSAKLVHMVQPSYPTPAKEHKMQGVVKLEAVISRRGTVQELKVIEGNPLLAQAALEAVKKWRYSPTTLNGQPVEVLTTINVNFKIQ